MNLSSLIGDSPIQFLSDLSIHFSEKSYLIYLILVPFFALLLFLAGKNNKKRLVLWGTHRVWRSGTHIWRISSRRVLLKALLLCTGTFLLIAALAQPRWGYQWKDVQQQGLDIMIALDISKSMLAEDIQPNRLEQAKREILDFLKELKGDRVGLIPFAGTAYVQCPLTLDRQAFEVYLEAMNPELIPYQGTDLAETINLALKSLMQGQGAGSEGKAILIISDGEDHSAQLQAALNEAKEQKVPIYTLGVGSLSSEGVPIPLPEGGFQKDEKGHVVVSRYKGDTLQRIARETGGRYALSVPTDEDLHAIYHNGLKSYIKDRKFDDEDKRKIWTERFQLFLGLGLLLIVLEMCLSSYKSSALCLLLLLVGGMPRSVSYAQESASNITQDDNASEYDHYNQAVSDYQKKDWEKAILGFQKTQTSQNEELRFRSQFNLGNAYYEMGQYDQAVSAYKEALSIKNDDKGALENLKVAQKEQEKNQRQEQEETQKKNNENNQEKNEENNQQENQENRENQDKQKKQESSDQQKPSGDSSEEKQDSSEKPQESKEDSQKESQKQLGEKSKQEAEQDMSQFDQDSSSEAENQASSTSASEKIPLSDEELKKIESARRLREYMENKKWNVYRPRLERQHQEGSDKEW